MMFQDWEAAWVAGIDGCSAGWVAFSVDTRTGATEADVVDVVPWLRNRPAGLAALAIDIPIGLMDGPRSCDSAARRLLGLPRCTSVFSAPCRAALTEPDHACASRMNRAVAGKGVSIQTWWMAPK